MLPYARLTPGAGFRAGRAVAYYAQRTVTHPVLRRAVSGVIAAAVRARSGAPRWRLGAAGQEALRALRTEGLARLDPLLSPHEAAEMRAYFETRKVAGPDGGLMEFRELPQDAGIAAYPLETVLACPGLLRLVNRTDVLALSAAYLGCKPTISSIGVRWTLPVDERATRFQSFHRDVDDWRLLKLFVYLTDVDEDSGPHVFVRGSHRTGFPIRTEPYTREGLAERYGESALSVLTGPKGTSFMADTLGVHRAALPTDRPRLMLQIEYSLLPVFAFLYEPVAAPEDVPLDRYCNRLLVRPRTTPNEPVSRGAARRRVAA